MSDRTYTVELPEAVAQTIERLAEARGVTPADFMADAVVGQVKSLEEAQAYFKARATRATPGAARKFFSRKSGEPPRPDDEIE